MNKNKKHMISIIAALFLCLANIAFAADKYEEGKIYKHQLDNGLTVYTMERHIAPMIYQQLTYKVGARNEINGITGISHIVEHMMFKGTEKYGKGKASKTISDNSGIFNAFTARDMTSYFEYMPKNKIEIALDIESDRMMNSMFDAKEYKSEIEVIKQERRMRVESSASGIFREELYSIAFKSHPNKNPVIGFMSDLNNITRDQAFQYYKTYYSPNNAFLVLVGDFATDEMVQKVKKYFSVIPKGPAVPEVTANEDEQLVQKSFTLVHPDITSPGLSYHFHIPVMTNPDAPAIKLAGKILCERKKTARLYKLLVTEKRFASMAAGGFGLSKDPDLFNLNIKLKKAENLDTVKAIIEAEIVRMQNEPVSEKELQRTKNNYRFAEETSIFKNSDIGSRISSWEAYFGYELKEKFDDDVMKVTPDDIMRVMKKYFNPGKATIGLMLPDKQAKQNKETADQEEESDKDGVNPEVFYYKYPCPVSNARESGNDGEILRPRKIAPLVKEAKLSNGIKVCTIENHMAKTISINGAIKTGLLPEEMTDKKYGIGTLLASVMNRGTIKEDANTLAERLSYIPISFSISGGSKMFSFDGFSLTKDADEMFRTGFEILTQPRFDDQEVAKARESFKQGMNDTYGTTSFEAFQYMYKQVYHDHPFSIIYAKKQSDAEITKQDLISMHKKYIRPELTTIYIMGDMTHKEMVKLAEKYFGKWKSNAPMFKTIGVPETQPLKGKELKVFTENSYKQCTINFGFSASHDLSFEEEETVDILNYILASSALTSRIGIELRDKQGMIYGFKSELHSQEPGMGYWKMSTKTAPKNAGKVISVVIKQIKKLIESGITDEELQNAKNHYTGLLPFLIETPDDIAGIVIGSGMKNKPLSLFDNRADRILAVTKEDVMRVAKKYLTADKWVICVDGPIESNSLDNLMNEL